MTQSPGAQFIELKRGGYMELRERLSPRPKDPTGWKPLDAPGDVVSPALLGVQGQDNCVGLSGSCSPGCCFYSCSDPFRGSSHYKHLLRRQ